MIDHPLRESALFLVGDLGATSVRLGLATPSGRMEQVKTYATADYADAEAVIADYLDDLPGETRPSYAGLAVGTTVSGDAVRLTNAAWSFSIEALRRRFALKHLVVLNDYAALAWSVRDLEPAALSQVGSGRSERNMPLGLVGASSGLGVSGLIPAGGGWVPLTGEGGHMTLAPFDDFEADILAWTRRRLGGHVSAERLVSASGLSLLREAIAAHEGLTVDALDPVSICRQAMEGGDALAARTVDCFCAFLGTIAANVALTLGARGGLYIGGGIVPRLGETFARSPFRARFESKGRFSDYLAGIPTYVIHSENAILTGVAIALQQALQGGMLRKIQAVADHLSPAERAVAEIALQQPRLMLDAAVAEIARLADVSQPTVIRFCRSLGCESLQEFRRKLAQSLSAGMPVLPAEITPQDSLSDVAAKVFDSTIAALLRNRDELAGNAFDEAVRLLAGGGPIYFFGLGTSGVVAEDAQVRFLRYGRHTSAYRDPHLMRIAAATLGAGATVVAISPSGRAQEVIAAVEVARQNGAQVVAIAPTTSPLAGGADVTIPVDLDEERDSFAPMVSRTVHLTLIDALAIGVALQDSAAAKARFDAGRRSLQDKFRSA